MLPRDAKAYWSSVETHYYQEDHPHRHWLVWVVRALHHRVPIRTALEFGCSLGRNLYRLQVDLNPALRATGLDIHESAIRQGRERHPGLDLRRGDEATLTTLADHEYDLVFTVSVLNHLPTREQVRGVLADFQRLSRAYVVLFEPWRARDEIATDDAHSYYWHYPALFAELGWSRWTALWAPLNWTTRIRKHYWIFVVPMNRTVPSLPLTTRTWWHAWTAARRLWHARPPIVRRVWR